MNVIIKLLILPLSYKELSFLYLIVMKNRNPLIIVIFVLVIVFPTCQEEENEQPNRWPECNIILPEEHSEIEQGEVVLIATDASDDDANLEYVRFTINGEEVAKVELFPYNYSWNTTDYPPDYYELEAIATDTKDKINRGSIMVSIVEPTLPDSLPEANFEADLTDIKVGAEVHFTDTLSKYATAWFWDFGDGHTSAEQSPSHIYDSVGTYHVKLKVINPTGMDSLIKENYINVDSTIEYGGGVTDIDGNHYSTVIIGEQEWMAENLKVGTYKDGTPITYNEGQWDVGQAYYCWYENDSAQYAPNYGALYSQSAVASGNLCPDGWHIPINTEWLDLTGYIADQGFENRQALALKSNTGWLDDGNGTDGFGFSALPAGVRTLDNTFSGLETEGWWYGGSRALIMNSEYEFVTLNFYGDYVSGFTVRCVKD